MLMGKFVVAILLLLTTVLFYPLKNNPDFMTRGVRELFAILILIPCVCSYLTWKHNRAISVLVLWIGLTTFVACLTRFLDVFWGVFSVGFLMSLTLIFWFFNKKTVVKTQYLIKVMAGIAILTALWGIFQWSTGLYWPFKFSLTDLVPVAALDNGPNYAAFLAITFPLVCYIHPLATIPLLAGIIISKSMTAFIAALAGMFFIYPSWKFIAGFCIVLTLFFFAFKTEITNFPSSSLLTRLQVWEESLKLAYNKPYIGFGAGSYKVIMPQYMAQRNAKSETRLTSLGHKEVWDNPSNDFIKIAFEHGFIAVIIVLSGISAIVWRYFNIIKIKESQILFGSFAALLIVCSGYSIFLNPTNAIWAAIIVALLNKELFIRRENQCLG